MGAEAKVEIPFWRGKMFVTEAELQKLTGYTRPSAQVRWLTRHGWRFSVNALGKPIVALAEFNRHMVGGKFARVQEPNWGAMHGSQRKPGSKNARK